MAVAPHRPTPREAVIVRPPAPAPPRALLCLLAARARGASPLAAPAQAAPGMEIGMEDERLMLSQSGARPSSCRSWKAPGRRLRAPDRRAGTRSRPASRRLRSRRATSTPPTPLDRRYRWGALDQAVDLLTHAGMKPMLTVTGPAPFWATADSAPAQGAVPAEGANDFGQFARRRGAALRQPRRPLSDLERAEPAGLAAAPARLHGQARARRCVHAALAARLPRALQRRRRGRSARADRGRADPHRRARARGRRPDEVDLAPALPPALPARAGLRRRSLPAACAAAAAGASRHRAPTPSATTRTASASRRRSRTPTAARRSSADLGPPVPHAGPAHGPPPAPGARRHPAGASTST